MAGIRTVLIIDSNKEDRAKVAVFLEAQLFNKGPQASVQLGCGYVQLF